MNTAFVTPKSKKSKNRFCSIMNKQSECVIEQHKENKVFLRSLNGKHFFWVSLILDKDWEIDL
jgi:hypothetical protein